MARRTVVIPPYFTPGGVEAVSVVVTFAPVDAITHAPVICYEDGQGIVGEESLTTNGVETSLSLATTDSFTPGSVRWKVSFKVGRKKYGPWYCELTDDGGDADLATMIEDAG